MTMFVIPGRLHMDRAGVGAGVRRGHRRPGAGGGRPADPGQGRRRAGAMAAAGAPHQGHARHLRARRRGHDLPRGPARSGDTEEPTHQI